MAESRRARPGYDTEAKDIYETPSVEDDASTVQSQRSEPESEPTSEEDDEESYGVSRRRLHPESARSRFRATSRQVEVKNVDLSDRVDGRRKGYRVRQGRGEDAGNVEEETLEARIARLRREIEECKVEAEEERQAEDKQAETLDGREQDMAGLSKLLASIGVPDRSRRRAPQRSLEPDGVPAAPPEEDESDEQTLTKVADFDTRLSALERALGISSLDSMTSEAFSGPLLPSLTLLDQQLSALSAAASTNSLDAASSRIQKLRQEAEQLSAAQAGSAINGDLPDDDQTPILSADDMQNLQSLYQLLPTLQSLARTVPAMLERLRSLRTLHTSAANAASELDDLEVRQREMDKELKEWKEGLESVERTVKSADEANGRNGKVVESWVRGLEARMKALK